jgi:excisionase family DNA binding protein
MATEVVREGDWLALSEAARLAEVHRTTLDRAAKRGELAYAKVPSSVFGRLRLFRAGDVLSWAEGRRSS